MHKNSQDPNTCATNELYMLSILTEIWHIFYYIHPDSNITLWLEKIREQLILTSSSRDETANVNSFYDDIIHILQNNKTDYSMLAKVYTNFIMVKSDLQLNFKVVMSK